MGDQAPDWTAVLETLQNMYPMHLHAAVQAVRIDELSREIAELREQLEE